MSLVLNDLYPLGQITDLGDVFRQERLIVKGRRHQFRLHDGPESDTTPADRVPTTPPTVTPLPTGRIHTVRDLRQDKKFIRTYAPVDEFGTPTTEAFDGTIVYTTDSPALINLTDMGAGSVEVAAVGGGALGPATLTFVASPASGGAAIQIDDVINVVVGAAEGFAVVDSPDEEVTPDV